jgi:AcrR family transcriptional regulator
MSAHPIPAPLEDDASSPDGRHRRSEESRKRIVQALLELVAHGDFFPSAEAVAEKAGVGLRSVFRHFKDMEGLRQEITASVEARCREIVDRPLNGDTWRIKLDDLVARRAQVFEQVMPYHRAGSAHQFQSNTIKSNQAELNRELRRILEKVVPKSIATDLAVMESLDLVMSIQAWIRLRIDQGLSAQQAFTVMKHLVEKLIPHI